jgi:hypothetical protein
VPKREKEISENSRDHPKSGMGIEQHPKGRVLEVLQQMTDHCKGNKYDEEK